MAIGTNDLKPKFGAGPDEVTAATPSTVPNNAFSIEADTIDWTNDEDAPYATLHLRFVYQAGALDLTDPHVNVYLQEGTMRGVVDNHGPQPAADNRQKAVGRFSIDVNQLSGDAAAKEYSCTIKLPNHRSGSVYRGYIENQTGVQMAAASGDHWNLWVAPFTFGPSA